MKISTKIEFPAFILTKKPAFQKDFHFFCRHLCYNNRYVPNSHGAGEPIMKIRESAEDYLETILILSERLPVVRSVDIATEMNF